MGIEQCRIIELPKISDPRGNLSFIESGKHIPFEIKRVYYLYDVPGGETRAGHALTKTEQFIIAAAGSFDLILDDGKQSRTIGLNRSWKGVYIPTMVWRELVNFSSGAVCLSLVSTHYDDGEYIRDYEEFQQAMGTRPR